MILQYLPQFESVLASPTPRIEYLKDIQIWAQYCPKISHNKSITSLQSWSPSPLSWVPNTAINPHNFSYLITNQMSRNGSDGEEESWIIDQTHSHILQIIPGLSDISEPVGSLFIDPFFNANHRVEGPTWYNSTSNAEHPVLAISNHQSQQYWQSSSRLPQNPSEPQSKPMPYDRPEQTKNIPKNYGKAIISHIKNDPLHCIENWLGSDFYAQLKEYVGQYLKSSGNMVKSGSLLYLWGPQCQYSAQIRAISELFFRKYACRYVFNSKIQDYRAHLKYRITYRKVLRQPKSFTNLKDNYDP